MAVAQLRRQAGGKPASLDDAYLAFVELEEVFEQRGLDYARLLHEKPGRCAAVLREEARKRGSEEARKR